MPIPNRLQTRWKEISPLLLKKWDRLTKADLEKVEGEFDRLVEVIKQRYDGPIHTLSEEAIRYEVLEMLKHIEG